MIADGDSVRFGVKGMDRVYQSFKMVSTVNIMSRIRRAAVIYVVFSMMLSGLLGVYPMNVWAESGRPEDRGDGVFENSGDWVIEDEDHSSFTDKTIIINGNLTVNGTLSLTNCTVIMNQTSTIHVNGMLNLTHTTITSNTTHYGFVVYGTLKMYNSTLSNMSGSSVKPYKGGLQVYSENVSIEGGRIFNCEFTGLYLTTNITVRNLTVEYNLFNVVINDASPILVNTTIRYPDSVSLYLTNRSIPSLLDTDIIGEKRIEDDSSAINICHLLDVVVRLENGTPISEAEVDIKSSDSQITRTIFTDFDGRVRGILLPEYTQHKSTSDSYHAPYIITAKKFGLTVAKSIPFDSSTEILITLSGDSFGHSIATGDFNGDGRMDLAVGVPRNITGVVRHGAVFVFFNDGLLEFYNLTERDADLWIKGEEGTGFGEAIATGDINGDGFDDLLVGAPNSGDGRGYVYFFYGSENPVWQATGDENFYIEGKGTGFGRSIYCRDFNVDGYSDFVIGDIDYSYVYYGSDDPKRDYTGSFHVIAHASSKGAQDNTGQPISKLESDDDDRYDVNPPASGENKLNILNFTVTGLTGKVARAELRIQYITDQYYGYYQSERGWLKGRIGPDDEWHNLLRPTDHHNSEATESVDLLAAGMDTIEALSRLEIYFENLDGTGGGSNEHYIHFDYILLDITTVPAGPNHTLESGDFSTGDVNGDGYPDLIIFSQGKQTVYYGGVGGLGAATLLEIDTYEGSFDNTKAFYRNLTLASISLVPNGDFNEGWDNWSFVENHRGEKEGILRLLDSDIGDWKVSPLSGAPTGAYGDDGDTLNGRNGDSSGLLKSEAFTLPDNAEKITLWHRWKVISFDTNEGMNIKLYRASDDTELLTIAEWMSSSNDQDHEETGILNASVVELRGETVYLGMETLGGDGIFDDGLFEIDDVHVLPELYHTNGTFISSWLNFKHNITAFTPEWNEVLNSGTITVKFRTNETEDWGNISAAENGISVELNTPSNRLQYRVELTGNANETPIFSNLTLSYLIEGQIEPFKMDTDYGIVKSGDINGDGADDLIFLKEGDLYWHPGSENLSNDFSTGEIELFYTGDIVDFSFIDLEKDGREEIVCVGETVTVLNSTGNEVFTDERGGLGCVNNVISDETYHLNSGRVFFIPSLDRDMRILRLEVPELIPPHTNQTINISVGNAGIITAENLTLYLNISAPGYSCDYTRTVNITSMDKKLESILWEVPEDEGVNYSLSALILMPGERTPYDNIMNKSTTSMKHGVSLYTHESFKEAHGGDVMDYIIRVNNTGTFPIEEITLSYHLPDFWTGDFVVNSTPVSRITVRDTITLHFRVMSPFNESSGDFVLNLSAETVSTMANLSLTARVLRPDLIVDEIALYRADGKRTNSTIHGVEGENETLRVHVVNQGPTYSTGFNVSLFVDGVEESSSGTNGLASGEGAYLYFSYIPVAGNHNISATVDMEDLVPEENEDNNTLQEIFFIKDRTPVGNYTISGMVQDLSGNGVSNAMLILEWEGKNKTLLTDQNGTFSYTILAEDYHDASILYLNATDGKNRTRENIILYSEDGGKEVVLTLRQYLVELDALDTIYSIEMGGNLTIPLWVKNVGNTNATFALNASELPAGWDVEFPDLLSGELFLNVGEEKQLSVLVSSSKNPLQSIGYERYYLTFLAFSVFYPEANDSVVLSIEVLPHHAMKVMRLDGENLSAEPGENVMIPLLAENRGNLRDTMIPTVTGLEATEYCFNISFVILNIGETAQYHLNFTMPNIPAGHDLNLLIGGRNIENISIPVRALPHYSITFTPPNSLKAEPEETLFIAVPVKNTGNILENITIQWEGERIEPGSDYLMLDINEESSYILRIKMPADALVGENIPIRLNLSTGNYTNSFVFNITAEEVSGLTLTLKNTVIIPEREFTIYRYIILAKNTGNGENTYFFSAAGDNPEYMIVPDPITIMPGETVDFIVEMVIPLNQTSAWNNYLIPVDLRGRQYGDINLPISSYSMSIEYHTMISQSEDDFLYNITLTNTGERFERLCTVLHLPEMHWYGYVNMKIIELLPGESITMCVKVTPPEYTDYWGEDLSLSLQSDTGQVMSINLHKPPIARLGADIPSLVTYQDELTFTGSRSLWNIVEYRWDFGDGSHAMGPTVKHHFSRSGIFTVTLTVVDELGLTDCRSIELTVENTPPIAIIVTTPLNATVEVGTPLILDASHSLDRDGEVVRYNWDFGDGEKGDYIKEEHIYSMTGNYVVTLTITDNAGMSANTTVNVRVVSPPTTSKQPSESAVIEKKTTDPLTYLPLILTATVGGAGGFVIYRKHTFVREMKRKLEEERKKKVSSSNNKK